MKTAKILLLLVVLFAVSCSNKEPQWKLGLQTYTFHNFTLMETLDKAQQLGLHYTEAFFFQQLGAGFPDTAYLNYDIDENTKVKLKEVYSKRGIQPYGFGVAFYGSETEWNQFFAFAHEMGIKVVTCEPALDQLDIVEQLALKYNIEVAIHNHPNPSIYADPHVLLKALEGRNPIMGVCADIGHWKRTGNDPLETVKMFAGRIKVVHLKDLNEKMEDMTWGTGVLPVKEVLQELEKQDFKGLVSIEYENFSDSQLDDIVKSIQYYKEQL